MGAPPILQIAALAIWMAGSLFLNLVFGPAVFLMISNRDEAEAAYSAGLNWLHRVGYAAGAIFLAARAWERSIPATAVDPASLGVGGMLALALVSSMRFLPRKSELREELGSVSATPGHDAKRVEFERLGRKVVRSEALLLALGLLALYLVLRAPH